MTKKIRGSGDVKLTEPSQRMTIGPKTTTARLADSIWSRPPSLGKGGSCAHVIGWAVIVALLALASVYASGLYLVHPYLQGETELRSTIISCKGVLNDSACSPVHLLTASFYP